MSNGEVRMGDARESKMLGLELVRFTCALSVLIWHYQHFYQAAGSPAYDRDAQPLHGLLSLFYDYGLFGVQIFWAISGFIFFWKYAEPIATGAIGGGRFFWLRLSRLYPLHFVTLLIVAGLQPIYGALTGGPLVYQHNDAMNFVRRAPLNGIPFADGVADAALLRKAADHVFTHTTHAAVRVHIGLNLGLAGGVGQHHHRCDHRHISRPTV